MIYKWFLTAVIFMACFGCAYQPSLNEQRWTQNNVQKLKTGMSPDEIMRIFGQPDKQIVNTQGALTAKPWQGLRYEYHFRKYGDYCINTFTFAMQETIWLNDWNINCAY